MLGSMSRFCMFSAKANEYDRQCDENSFNTDCNWSSNHLPNSFGKRLALTKSRNCFCRRELMLTVLSLLETGASLYISINL